VPEDDHDAPQPETPEGPSKDPQSADVPAREEGRQNAIVHEGAEPDEPDPNENADQHVRVEQPDGSLVPEPED
jgi:hypothetical protein